MLEAQIDLVPVDHFEQGVGVFLNPKDDPGRDTKGDMALVGQAIAGEVVGGQVHDLLRRAGALNGGAGLGEDGLAPLKLRIFSQVEATVS